MPWCFLQDYWTSTVSNNTDGFCSQDSNIIDLWHHDINSGNSGGPAIPRPGGADADVYEEEIFVAKATSIIKSHSDNGGGGGDGSNSVNNGNGAAAAAAMPSLFLYYASHAPHTPMQVPQRYLDRMLNVTELSLTGQGYAAMVAVADDALGNITTSLKEAGMWEDTLLVFMSDNGGPIYDQNFKETGGCPDTKRFVSSFEVTCSLRLFFVLVSLTVCTRVQAHFCLAQFWAFKPPQK